MADAAAGSRSSHFREDANRCTVGVLWLAGIPGRRQSRPPLATSLSEAELIATAERLERAYDREARIVALDIPDREAIVRMLEDCPGNWRSCGRHCYRSTSGDSAKGSPKPRLSRRRPSGGAG